MPELPEVETTLRGIQPELIGQRIQRLLVRNPKLRWPVEAHLTHTLAGLKIIDVSRRAKYLLLKLADASSNQVRGHVILHLGMSGNLRTLPESTPAQKHDHIDLLLENRWVLRYHDPRRFGAFLWTDKPLAEHILLKHLAPEPLSEAFTGKTLYPQLHTKQANIKSVIMNNHYVVGVGNIYANEALFMSGIHPETSAGQLTENHIELLVGNIKKVLAQAITQGGTTLKDFLSPDGNPGYFEQELQVYGREKLPCPQCQTLIQRKVLQQRASYFCPQCQPKQ